MKVISGGQTGSDLGGLEGAKLANVETGGHCPAGYRTENGQNLELKEKYNLTATLVANYNYRTKKNIDNSDGTAIFADKITSGGTVLTINTCREMNKPYICNPTVDELVGFISFHKISTLNVAGNRESVAPGIQEKVKEIVYQALTKIAAEDRMVE